MGLEEILALLRENIPEDDYLQSESFLTGMQNQTNELSAFRDSADAKVQALEVEIQGLKDEVSTLKAQNYDLLMQTGAPVADVDPDGDEGGAIENEVDDGEVIHVDDLFEDEGSDSEPASSSDDKDNEDKE